MALRRLERIRPDRLGLAGDGLDLGPRPGAGAVPAQPARRVWRGTDGGHAGQPGRRGRDHPAGSAGLAEHEHSVCLDDLPPHARRPRRAVRRRHALPVRVLGLTTVGVLGAIHLDLAKISVVLAALGVGLGFGLQEIVSNFVCGIILLLERPIRIGDVVTVAGSTGKVDRINIRATTIVNSDNQSMIVPNREFITGNLVNWTHKDKILRVPIKVGVAYGTDPDRVVDLLLAIAREDSDVLVNPAPGASLEAFGDSALLFSLSAFVPDPGLAGIVRHRLCSEIQRRFAKEGIIMPYPTQEFQLSRVPNALTETLVTSRQDAEPGRRYDPSSRTPPAPHGVVAAAQPARRHTAGRSGPPMLKMNESEFSRIQPSLTFPGRSSG